MSDIKIKWLFYTLLIAFIPFIVRLILNISTNVQTDILTISDLVAFSLVMQVSTIGGAESLTDKNKKYKTICYSLSVILVLFSGIYYALSLVAEKTPEIMNLSNCVYVLLAVCLVSTILSYATHDKIYKNSIMINGGN